jgi:uncharacterized repeat protein (TIGR01451 family)
MEAGERWYGALSLGTHVNRPGNIATIPVNVGRYDDDVTKTVDATEVGPGGVVTYTLSVAPNITSQALSYTLRDTLPSGLTYVDGSASPEPDSAGAGELHWEFGLPCCAAPADDPFVITYEASVDGETSPGVLTNTVVHEVDQYGSRPASASASVTVGEAAALLLVADPTSIDFGEVAVGGQADRSVTLTNDGDRPIVIADHEIQGSADFEVVGSFPAEVAPSGSEEVQLRFSPAAEGYAVGTLAITHDGGNDPLDIQLSGQGLPAPELVRLEETEGAFSFGRGWVSQSLVVYSGGAARSTQRVGSSVEVLFTGGVVKLLGVMGPNRGVASISIDGVDHGTVDTYSESHRFREPVFTAGGLGDGAHRMVITFEGAGVSQASSVYFTVDAVEAAGGAGPLVRLEETEGAFSFGGGWVSQSLVVYSGGAARSTQRVGSSVEVLFTGGVVKLLGVMGPNRGVASITIDGVDHGTVDTYSEGYRFREPVFTAGGLGDGAHRMVITFEGAGVSQASSVYFTVDAVDAEGPA